MAFNFSPGKPGETTNQALFDQFLEIMQRQFELQQEEAGFERFTETLDLEAAKEFATPDQLFNLDLFDRDISEIEAEIAAREEEGFEDARSFGTSAGRDVGHGDGLFTTDQLRQELKDRQNRRSGLIGEITNVTRFRKTPERLEQEAAADELRKLRQENIKLQEERLGKGLKGDLADPLTEQEVSDAIANFKESQARVGNKIEGSTLDELAGKGDVANRAVEEFRRQILTFKDQQRRATIQGESPLAFSGFSQIPALSPGAAGVGIPNPYGQAIGVGNQSLLPFQFNEQLEFQRNQAAAARAAAKSAQRNQLITSGVGLAASLATLPFFFGAGGAGVKAATGFGPGGIPLATAV